MNSWNNRSKEVANLLNPAFCCVALTTSIINYSNAKNIGMPVILAYIILPVLLNDKSRNELPKRTNTSLASWLDDHFNIRLILQEMIIPYKPYVKESILFGLVHDWLFLTNTGELKSSLNKNKINKIIENNYKGDTKDFFIRSRFLGKWFALSGTTETVMALWGVKP